MTTPEYAMMMAQEYKMDSLKKENERLRKEYEEKLKKEKKKYESLYNVVYNWGDFGRGNSECGGCEIWFHVEHVDHNHGCGQCDKKWFICDDCYESGEYKKFKCTPENCECLFEGIPCQVCSE